MNLEYDWLLLIFLFKSDINIKMKLLGHSCSDRRDILLCFSQRADYTISRSLLICTSLPAARMKGSGMIVLLVSVLVLTVCGSSAIHSRPYSRFVKRDVNSSQTLTWHNATLDCGDLGVLMNTTLHCVRDLTQLAQQGYPWSPRGRQKIAKNVWNITDNKGDALDLDSLNHVCHIQDRNQMCLREHDIQDFCLSTVATGYIVQVDFQFICHHRQRDENLVRSLRCLQEKRLLVMLNFHIARRCRGFGILDDIMRQKKNAYVYLLNIYPISYLAEIPLSALLYCIPKHVITTCIGPFIDDYCGAMTADLVQHYILYSQGWLAQAFRSAGLSSDICENDIIGSNYTPDVPRIPPLHGKLGFLRLLEMSAPGTALDTVFGQLYLVPYLQSLSGEELCTTEPAFYAYTACVMSSYSKAEMTKFNILQFAQRIIPVPYHGSHCNRLELFTACWNLLQQICGPKARGLEHHATLFVEGCKIGSEMDTAGCHWEDMLLSQYIQASQVTAWPLTIQCMMNPMWLENSHYHTSVTKDLDKVVSLLQPGVEDISRICGRHLASGVQSLLENIRYLQSDAFEYAGSLHSHHP